MNEDMNAYIDHKLPTRKEVLKNAFRECLDTMFRLAQPSITLNELEYMQHMQDNKKIVYQDRYYLPSEVFDYIKKQFMDAYGIESPWKHHVDTISEYIFDGGHKIVPKTQENPFGVVTLGPLKLSDKDRTALMNRIDDCKKFYKFNNDEMSFSWGLFNSGPSSNAEAVEEYWRNNGHPEFKIDQNIYK